jgi:hypothetical protein
MSDEGPPPIVPNVRTDADETADVGVRADGGARETPADRPSRAPLVPDCS